MGRDRRHDVLFEPLQIGPKRLRNRFFQVPHSNGFGTDRPGSQAGFRATRAEGGWAAVADGITSVDPESDRVMPAIGRLWDGDDGANLRAVADAVHAHGALLGVELFHSGPHSDGGTRIVAGGPSPLPSEANPLKYARELHRSDIRRLQAAYVEAAERAAGAGGDIVYVYGSHGYLPMQFLSSFSNHRDDNYGGSLHNRARFWLETLAAVRSAVGDCCAIAVRIAVDGRGPTGLVLEESLQFVRWADDLVDLWDVNIATNTENWHDMGPSRLEESGWQRPWTGRVREATAKPIVGVGRYTDPDLMAEVIRSGRFDLIGAARPSIADPFLPRKVEEGRYDEIRECIGCNYCLYRIQTVAQISCTQNPTAGEEFRRGWHPERPRPVAGSDLGVLVVGGGVAGMECALTLGRRGFGPVHLVECSAQLGGYARTLASLPGLAKWEQLVTWRATQLSKLRTVEVHTGVHLDDAAIVDYGAEVVVLATGARWSTEGVSPFTHAPVPGWDRPAVWTPEDVLADVERGRDQRVVVYDCEGWVMGVGVAEVLAGRAAHVTVVTPLPVVAPTLDLTFEGDPVRRHLTSLGVHLVADTSLLAIDGGSCRVERWGREERLACDAVVLLTSRRPLQPLPAEPDDDRLSDAGVRAVHVIGDAAAPRLLAECVFDGHRLGMLLHADGKLSPDVVRRERSVVGATFRI